MNQSVRIIGGRFRGKKIKFLSSEGLRPTPDRVRETLFNWLMPTIYQARCLDAFAGSGALGFEAYSRGASRVVLTESAYEVYSQLKKIADDFNDTAISIIHKKVQDYLQKSDEIFDIVFLDPPYALNCLPECIELLSHSNVLVPGGLVYIESPDKISVDKKLFTEIKIKQAGQVIYGLYKKN